MGEAMNPAMRIFCLLKSEANFGMKLKWHEVLSALRAATDMGLLPDKEFEQFQTQMRKTVIQGRKEEGYSIPTEDRSRDQLADSLLKDSMILRPRQVMGTLSALGICEIDPEWHDFVGAD